MCVSSLQMVCGSWFVCFPFYWRFLLLLGWCCDCRLCSAPCGYGKRLLVCRWVRCTRWGLPLCISISHPGRNHLLGLNFLVSLWLSTHTNGFTSGANTRAPCWLVKWRIRANSPRDLSTSSGHPVHTFSINYALGTPWVSPSTSLLLKSNVFWILGLAGFAVSITLILYSFCCLEDHQHPCSLVQLCLQCSYEHPLFLPYMSYLSLCRIWDG